MRATGLLLYQKKRELELLANAVDAYGDEDASIAARRVLQMFNEKLYPYPEADDRLRTFVERLASGLSWTT